MAGLTNLEMMRVVNRWIGVSGGYLGDFSYRTHADFYPEYCDLKINPYDYEGTTRERFIAIISSSDSLTQAKILRGVLERFHLLQQNAPSTRTEDLKLQIEEMIERLEQIQPTMLLLPSEQIDIERKLRVFLCHASQDKAEVRKLCNRFQLESWIDPWLDAEKLKPGQEWEFEIEKAVDQTNVVVVCLSKSSISKEGYIQKEIKRALDKAEEKPEGTIFIISLRLEECDVPVRLKRWQWTNLYEKGGYEKLIQALEIRANTFGIELRSF